MFEAYSTTSQTLATNATVALQNTKYNDCRIELNNNTATISAPGYYYVEFDAVGSSGTAASPFTLQLFNNGTAVPEAISTITSTEANDAQTMHFSTIVRVNRSCCVVSNEAALQVKVTSNITGAVTTASLLIWKVK